MRNLFSLVFICCFFVHPTVNAADEKIACPSAYQPIANRCVSQRMADFIACVEATGGGKETLRDEIIKTENSKAGGKVSGSGSGVVVKGSGSLVLDRNAEMEIAQKIEKKWFPGGLSECRAVLEQKTDATKKK